MFHLSNRTWSALISHPSAFPESCTSPHRTNVTELIQNIWISGDQVSYGIAYGFTGCLDYRRGFHRASLEHVVERHQHGSTVYDGAVRLTSYFSRVWQPQSPPGMLFLPPSNDHDVCRRRRRWLPFGRCCDSSMKASPICRSRGICAH